jgi:ABC-2 type transport system permease protein
VFGKILLFELRYQFRRPSFYICLAAAMVVAFLLVTALAEAAGDERALLKFNAPIMAAQFVSFVSFFTLLIPLVMFGRTAMRDVDAGTEEVVRATPAPLAGLLLARFTAAFVLVTLVYVTLVPSAELALRMPWIDAELVGPFRLGAYAQTYALMTLLHLRQRSLRRCIMDPQHGVGLCAVCSFCGSNRCDHPDGAQRYLLSWSAD